MADSLNFRAVFAREPDGRAWTATSPDVEGAITWGRSLKGAEDNLREAIALVRGLPKGAERDIQFEAEFDLGDEHLTAVFHHALQTRGALMRAQRAANDTAALAIFEGQNADMSVRDLAALIGVSHQRVQQIASEIRERPTATSFESSAQSSKVPDQVAKLRGRLHFRVVEDMGPTLYDREMSDAELRLRVLEVLEWAVDHEQSLPLTEADRRALVNEVASDILEHAGVRPHSPK